MIETPTTGALEALLRDVEAEKPSAVRDQAIKKIRAQMADLEADSAVSKVADTPSREGDAERLRQYWSHGEGAAKIGWGTPGDFDRCVLEVGKYMNDPKGYCAARHHDALGIWPATHAAMERGHKGADTGPTLSKDAVDYRRGTDARHCGNCSMFIASGGGESGQCTLVKGIISPDAVCDRWDAKAEKAARGYDINPRSGMISLDIPEGVIPQHPGGVTDHHITVVYLGSDLSDEQWETALSRAADAAAKIPGPITAMVAGVDSFPPSAGSDWKIPAYAPVVIPGAVSLRNGLADLSASEHKDWRPHVTLAYVDGPEEMPEPVPVTPVTFTHLSVHLGDHVERIPFGAAP